MAATMAAQPVHQNWGWYTVALAALRVVWWAVCWPWLAHCTTHVPVPVPLAVAGSGAHRLIRVPVTRLLRLRTGARCCTCASVVAGRAVAVLWAGAGAGAGALLVLLVGATGALAIWCPLGVVASAPCASGHH